MRNHMKSKHEKGGFECNICQKSFATGYYLKRHMKAVHEKINPSKAKCELCFKVLSSRSNMTAHIKSVHKQWKIVQYNFFYLKKYNPDIE